MNGAVSIVFAPLLPWSILAPLMALAAMAAAMAFAGRGRGRWWRTLMLAGIVLALCRPSTVTEQRQPLKDVALVVVDRSPSQHFPGRMERTDKALAALKTELARFPDLDTRIVDSDANPLAEQTNLFGPRADAMNDVPRDQVAGTFLLTDGEVQDIPKPSDLAGQGPVHVLLTGVRDERDRRLEIVDAPGYGIVGGKVTVTLRVIDANIPASGLIPVTVTQDGEAPRTALAQAGVTLSVEVPITHGGPTTVALEAATAEGELTATNNRAAVVINGVRERLRVLLISGEPHAGERTWRNLLKADPSVDLVHFTILRSPEKNDGTPVSELSLIAFPFDELFNVRLHEFDLVIFDHYQQMILLPEHYANLANYVRNGGALLEASGPAFQSSSSLYRTALKAVLPGAPTGREINETFRPAVTDLGQRHPVTTDLPGYKEDAPADWGRWFRQGDITPTGSDSSVVMTGAEGKPLLLLSHEGKGRVAELASDQIWLWSRGYDGGGPQGELLRRLAHWLMKEPELDENQLSATVKNRQIAVAQRFLQTPGEPLSVTVTGPDGAERQLALADAGKGVARGTVDADSVGLYKVTSGGRTAFAVIGSTDTPELRDVLTTESRLKPVVTATGGALSWIADDERLDIRRVDADGPVSGRGWMGLRRNGRYSVRGVTEIPLLPAGILLILLGGALGLAWRRESR